MKKKEEKYEYRHDLETLFINTNQLNIRGSIIYWELAYFVNSKKNSYENNNNQ